MDELLSLVSIDLVRAARRSGDLEDASDAVLKEWARDYVRFLVLAKEVPNEPIAPTRAIDRMWHLHMLHPCAYVEDCERIFGEILDHDGGFGRAAEEEADLQATFERTAGLWLARWGELYVGSRASMTKCKRNCVSRCKRACKSPPRRPISREASTREGGAS